VLVGAAALVVVAADGVGAVAAGAGAPGGVAAGVGMLPVDEVLSDLKNCSLLLCSCNREQNNCYYTGYGPSSSRPHCVPTYSGYHRTGYGPSSSLLCVPIHSGYSCTGYGAPSVFQHVQVVISQVMGPVRPPLLCVPTHSCYYCTGYGPSLSPSSMFQHIHVIYAQVMGPVRPPLCSNTFRAKYLRNTCLDQFPG